MLLDVDKNARQAIAVDPRLVLEGHVPRLIDEWQIEPDIWNHIRRAVDDRGEPGGSGGVLAQIFDAAWKVADEPEKQVHRGRLHVSARLPA